MEVIGRKSNRLLIVDIVMLAICAILATIIGLFASSKVLIIVPVCIMLFAIVSLVQYFITPKDVLVIDGDNLVYNMSFKKKDIIPIKDIVGVVYGRYGANAKDGTLSLDVKHRRKAVTIGSLANIVEVRYLLYEKRKEFPFDGVFDINLDDIKSNDDIQK